MRQIPLNELSFLQIQVFLTAAEELNFTRTAKRCHVTQPTVSRLIDSMEKLTGIQLFTKDHAGMKLTPAGKRLKQSLGKAVDMINVGFVHAWELQEGYGNLLNICFTQGTHPNFIFDIAKRFKKKHESVKIHYQMADCFNEELRSLFSYESDILITHSHHENFIAPYAELKYQELIHTPLTVFMKRTNPLSCRRHLTFSDLKLQKIIFPKMNTNYAYESMILDNFAKENVIPMFAQSVSTAEEGVLNLQEDNEVLILNHFANYFKRKDCTEIPLKDTKSGLLLVTRATDAEKKYIKEFSDMAVAYCQTLDYSMDE